jgi:DNA-binding phage protein
VPAKKLKGVDMRVRDALTKNVNRLVNVRYRNSSNRVNALAKDSGVGRSTVQRILDPETYDSVGPSIDTVAQIAQALNCRPYELLVDD